MTQHAELGMNRVRWTGTLALGVGLVAAVVLAALLSFVWTPYDPTVVDSGARLLHPSAKHWLGTDDFGRDIFSSLLVGARTTLLVGVVAVAIAASIGIPIGVAAGMRPGVSDEILMRGNDVLLAFPALLLAIVFAAVWGGSTVTAMTALGVGTAPAFARVARGGTRQVMAKDYVLAARAAGKSPLRIALRHVLPNISSALIVQASVTFAIAVLAEAALSYLGFGTPPPTPSWGRMLQESQPYLYLQPAVMLWPGLAIALTVLGFNLLGDGLRDRFDPKTVRQ
ncbi:peptide/nickel transport system permease protein [Rhodococcus sp. PvR044]|uniref:ABC transporter permease n=1 Tax=Rhodococcus TaxID=1827 RepID=UPI001B5B2BE7|nr:MULTISPECIES: ABC transporter permease [Rhodococcus]MBP1158735.1 peptide/nickel transport system permease protein [Rhodococcus sp. PvR099]MCZ4558480.1 ABC transporter permease [Rhodococcus maanshanensis]